MPLQRKKTRTLKRKPDFTMISSENRANAKLTRFSGIFLENEDTNSIKINRLGYNMSFWLLTVHVQQNIFEQTLIEVYRPHLYASFGTFCFKLVNYSRRSDPLNIHKNSKSATFPSKTTICPCSNIIQRLTVFPIIDQSRRKRCQTKREDIENKLLYEFFKYTLLFTNCGQSRIRSLHTYF